MFVDAKLRTSVLMAAIVAAGLLAGTAADAASCSSWRATCVKRGGGADCDAKFDKCMATGTWTEGAKFGGGTHSGVTKK